MKSSPPQIQPPAGGRILLFVPSTFDPRRSWEDVINDFGRGTSRDSWVRNVGWCYDFDESVPGQGHPEIIVLNFSDEDPSIERAWQWADSQKLENASLRHIVPVISSMDSFLDARRHSRLVGAKPCLPDGSQKTHACCVRLVSGVMPRVHIIEVHNFKNRNEHDWFFFWRPA